MSTAVSLKYPVVKFQATVTSIRESQLVYRELHPTSIIAFLNSNKTEKLSPSSQSDENKKCAYCNRRGHLRESCFSWLEKKTPDGSKWSTKNPKKAAKKHKLKEKSSRRRGEAKKNSRNNSSINTRIVDDTKHGAANKVNKIAAFEEWRETWTGLHKVWHSTYRTPADPKVWKAATIAIDKNTGRIILTNRDLSHDLCSFTAVSPNPAGRSSQHMVLGCHQWAEGRGEILRQAKDRSYEAMMKSPYVNNIDSHLHGPRGHLIGLNEIKSKLNK
ncbi:hypothetical protein EV44_g3271 [Erysiphe necator]|uniref:Uncharacterized protein n=1 Tax=Uncinula necator TaxID=52586 RepID=A0A0B1PDG2_UNCNE|nr:hypothetical protein EV44_g3271 [Erysiphe necator]